MRVPTYRRQTERTNQIGGRTFTVQASPGALSAGAMAASQFFDQATEISYDFAIEKERVERETQVMEASTEYKLELEKISNEVLGKGKPLAESKAELRSLIADAQKRILAGNYQRYDGSTANPISNRRAVEYLRNNVFPEFDFAAIEDVDKEVTKRLADNYMSTMNRDNEVSVQQAAFATSALKRQVILDNIEKRIDNAVALGHLTKVEAEDQRVKIRDDISKLTAATLLENIKNDPAGADRALQLAEERKLDLNPDDIIKLKTEGSKLKADFIKKTNKEKKSELSAYLVNYANAQDKVSNLAYLIETGNPTGDPVMDKIAEQFTVDERRDIGKEIRQARKDHIDSINREDAFEENKRKEVKRKYDALFYNLEARNAPIEDYQELINEVREIDRVYALNKTSEYITPQGGFKKRPVEKTTPRGLEWMQKKHNYGSYSITDLQNTIFENELTPADKEKYSNKVFAADEDEIKDAMLAVQANLNLPAGFENSVMSENNPHLKDSKIFARVKNRLVQAFNKARKTQQDFDGLALGEKFLKEEQAAIEDVIGKKQREQAESAIVFANKMAISYPDLAKQFGGPVFTNENMSNAHDFLVKLYDIPRGEMKSKAQSSYGNFPARIDALERMILGE